MSMQRGDLDRGGFLGSITHAIGGAIGGFVKGGPVGAITGAIRGAVDYNMGESGAAQPIGSLPPPPPMITPMAYTGGGDIVEVHRQQAEVYAQAQAAGVRPGTNAVMAQQMISGVAPKGYHVRKKPYRPPLRTPATIVRNRSMNVTNTRALRRALRRAYGFSRIAMKTIKLIHPAKKGRFGGFKKRGR